MIKFLDIDIPPIAPSIHLFTIHNRNTFGHIEDQFELANDASVNLMLLLHRKRMLCQERYLARHERTESQHGPVDLTIAGKRDFLGRSVGIVIDHLAAS